MAGRDMPPAGVLAADQHLDADARALKAAGAGGTLAQLRAAVFLARLNGQPLHTLLPAPHQHPGNERPGNEYPGGPGQDLSAGQDGNPAGEHSGTNDDGPGAHGAGATPVTATARVTVTAQVTVTAPDRAAVRAGRPGPGPGTGPGTGWPPAAGPGSGAGLTGTINLTVPLATWLGLAGQPGEAAGYGHLDAAACRDLAAAIAAGPGARWHLIITGPDGTAIGYGRARKGNPPPDGPPPPGGTGPPGGPAPPGGTGRPAGPRHRPGGTGPPGGPSPPGGTGQSGGTGPSRRPRTTRLDRQCRPAPLARGHQDQLAGDRDLRACQGNVRVPAISHLAEPDQDPQPRHAPSRAAAGPPADATTTTRCLTTRAAAPASATFLPSAGATTAPSRHPAGISCSPPRAP